MKKLIVANWKENPATLAQAEEILARVDEWLGDLNERHEMSLIFCPPFKYLEDVARILKTGHLEHMAELGAQDMKLELAKLGVRYVIIGHSSRRAAGESDEVVNQKLRSALQNELVPIVCIGEGNREGSWREELQVQTHATFAGLSADDIEKCLIVYEPVWAISTNPGARPDTPVSALQSVKLIRDILRNEFGTDDMMFLYGGSITERNAAQFLMGPAFAGILIGGASVRKDEFCRILSIAAELQ